ncbi:uncharacterized protein F4812DRAFT_456995 [Daldinia caldariorum]|uniref:uncharacterized protein n=1 Tax=Daldinia caldariorum TaxID=326644 RepID=UPI002008DD7A|nr:uncharacterized protein F4812DRAFT_456995 [Daldinia caldariorum]KAI1469595.1 hypothetical protein F4812DRAFT_456995 [Daldinia caldariorum]
MASTSQNESSAWKSAILPQEVFDKIALLSGRDGRAIMTRVSSYFKHAFAGAHYNAVRFTDTQRRLSYTLKMFIFTCEETPFTSGSGNRPFNHYIKAANIEYFDPPQGPTEITGWKFAADSPRLGWNPDSDLPSRIVKAISLMPNVEFLTLILDHFTAEQHSQMSVRNHFYNAVGKYHQKLERLHLALRHGDFPSTETASGMPEYATNRIRQDFGRLKWLTLEFNHWQGCWHNKSSFNTQRDKFVEAIKKLKHLERLAFTIRKCHIPQDSNIVVGGGDRSALYKEVIQFLGEKSPTLLSIAILVDYPTYYLGERDRVGAAMSTVCMDARNLRHDSWPTGVRDD